MTSTSPSCVGLFLIVLLAASAPSLSRANLTDTFTLENDGTTTLLAFDVSSDTLWVAFQNATLKVYAAQTATGGGYTELATYPILAHSIAFFGSQAFVAAGPLGVVVLNVTDVREASTLSRLMYGGYPACLVTLMIATYETNASLTKVFVASYEGQTSCPDINAGSKTTEEWKPTLLTYSVNAGTVAVSRPFPTGHLITSLARQNSHLTYATPTVLGAIPDWVSNDEIQIQPCGGGAGIAHATDDMATSLVASCIDGTIVSIDLDSATTGKSALELNGENAMTLCLVPNRDILFLTTDAGRLYAVDYHNNTAAAVIGELPLRDDGCNECVVAGSFVHVRCRDSIHKVAASTFFNGSSPNAVLEVIQFNRLGATRAITASPTRVFFADSGTLYTFASNETHGLVVLRWYALNFVPWRLAYDRATGALFGATSSAIYSIALSSGAMAVTTPVLTAQTICAVAVEKGIVAGATGAMTADCSGIQLRNGTDSTVIGDVTGLRNVKAIEVHSGRVLALANDTVMVFSFPPSGSSLLTLDFTYEAPAPVASFFSLLREDGTLAAVYVSTPLGVDVLHPTMQRGTMEMRFSHRWSDSYWQSLALNGVAVNSEAAQALVAAPAGSAAEVRIVDLERNIVIAGDQRGFSHPSVNLVASPPVVLLYSTTFIGLVSTPPPITRTLFVRFLAAPTLSAALDRDWGCSRDTETVALGGFESYSAECDPQLSACLQAATEPADGCLRTRFQCVLRGQQGRLALLVNQTQQALDANPMLLENATALYRSCAQFVCSVSTSLNTEADVCPFVVQTTINVTLQLTSSARRQFSEEVLQMFQLDLQAALGFQIVRGLQLQYCEKNSICIYSFAVGGVSPRSPLLHLRTSLALSSLRASASYGFRLISLVLGERQGKESPAPPSLSPTKNGAIVPSVVAGSVGVLVLAVLIVLAVVLRPPARKAVHTNSEPFSKPAHSPEASLGELLLLRTRPMSLGARRDAALSAASLAIRTVAKTLDDTSSKDDRAAQWQERSRLISHIRNAADGPLDNGLEFALDVTEEVLCVAGLELAPQVREPVDSAIRATAAALSGDVASLHHQAESAGTSDELLSGWLCDVLHLWRIDGAEHDADTVALLRTQLRRKPLDDWHALYQWLLLVDEALESNDAEIRELALQSLRVSGLADHPHWRVREKVADTVARIARRTDSDGNGHGVTAAEIYAVMRGAEVDERVLAPLREPEVEHRLHQLIEEHREQVDTALHLHVQRGLEEADRSATELARSVVAVEGRVEMAPESQAILARGQHSLERCQRVSRSLRGTFRTGAAPVFEHSSSGSDPDTLPAATSTEGSEYSDEDVTALKTRLEASVVWEGPTADLATEMPLGPRLRRLHAEIERTAKDHPDVISRFPMLRALLRDMRDPLEGTLQTAVTAARVLIHCDLLNTLLSVKELLTTAICGRELALRLLDHHTLTLRLRLAVCFQRLRLQIGATALPAITQAPLSLEVPSDFTLEGLRLCDILDSNANSKVVKVEWQRVPVAVKLLNSEANGRVLLEAGVQGRLCHPHIAALFGCVEQRTQHANSMLVLELVERTLADAISNTDLPFAIHDKARVSLQLALAMQYLHSAETDPVSQTPRMILHGDLKPTNVMLDKRLNVKLIDFGHAAWRASTHSSGSTLNADSLSERGTTGYQSPEGFRGEPVTTRSDVFSFGTVLYEIWTRQQAFSNNAAIASAMSEGNMPRVDGVEDVRVQNLILRCWNEDPMKRPCFTLIALELLRINT